MKPSIQLSPETDQTLYLIREELKSRKIFHTLRKLDISCHFLPSLDPLILKNIGLDSSNDDTLNAYHVILDKRSKKIKSESESIRKHALKAYQELRAEKIKRSQHKS